MKLINQIINWITIGLIFLLPLFFLPITTEFYIFNKQALLIGFAGVMTLLWLAKMALRQTLIFRRTVLDLPIVLFVAAYIIASLVATPNKILGLTAPTGVSVILALALIYFVITNNLKKETLPYLLYALIASTALLALVAVYQFLGFGETLATTLWLKSKLFTPTGGPLILTSVLVIGLALAVTLFLKQFYKKNLLITILTGGASIIIAVGLILTVYQLLPGKATSLTLLSYPDSWAVAIESFKRNPLFGVGPGNYVSAFNRFRPVTFNNNDFWDIRFGNASSYPLELLTIGGLSVLGTYLFLLLKALNLWLKTYRQQMMSADKRDDAQLALLIGLVLVLFLPWLIANNLILLMITFIFLALLARLTGREELVRFKSKTLSLIGLGVGLLLIIPSFYFWGRVYAADMAFRQSLNALAQNQGIVVYNQQVRAISLNPYSPQYRRAYSQTNFALANSLASQAELTDQDRTNITQLIQQAIREAKAATVLNPTDAANWENLSQIYRNLINFAQGADQWAIAAYRQAIVTDPINPRIRLNLGGLFYGFQNYEAATRHFQNAVDLKPDYANGYYNLAATYREREMYPEAYLAMQTVVNLIPADTPDYQKAVSELDELAKKLPTPEEVTPPEEEEVEPVLTEPSPLPSPVIEPPIELPEEEAAPEIPEEEEEEEPSPSPEVSPTP
ncbi:hypothetical protein AMJ51_00200 [Microgenomates bacterium DG_75]|nr:MAG: hypothetical protein AMJ51_00200 [Microgenomates bacterium DG_75]